MTPTQHSALVLPILSTVALDRFEKAICGLTDNTLTVTLTKQTEAEISAYVANGKGQTYGVTIATDGKSFCNCGDRMHRADLAHCKHAAALALHAIRTPAPQLEVEATAIDVPAIPIPVGVAPVVLAPSVGVVSPLPCLCWSDGLTVCGSIPMNHVHRYPWNQVMLEGACRECLSVYTRGYHNSHMIHVMSQKHAA